MINAQLRNLRSQLLDQNSYVNIFWNLVFFMQLFVNAFYIPVCVVFKNDENYNIMTVLSYIFDFMYVFNVFLDLSVSFFEIKIQTNNFWKIAAVIKNYLMTNFALDVIVL